MHKQKKSISLLYKGSNNPSVILQSKIPFNMKIWFICVLLHMKFFSYVYKSNLTADFYNIWIMFLISVIVMVSIVYLRSIIYRNRFALGIFHWLFIAGHLVLLITLFFVRYYELDLPYIAVCSLWMQETLECYLIGLTLKMEGGRGSGFGSGGPSGQGPAGQAGGIGTSTPVPAGFGVLPINKEGAYSFDNLDKLVEQLRQQIKQGLGPSPSEQEVEVANEVDMYLAKLQKWDNFMEKDLPNKVAPLSKYSKYFSEKEWKDFSDHTLKMGETKAEFSNKKVRIDMYANAHKNLCNKQKDNWNKFFAKFNPVISRLASTDPEQAKDLSNQIAYIKKDQEFKQNVKLDIAAKLKESSIKYINLKKN